MASYKNMGDAHKIIYSYQTGGGGKKQQWETYSDELDALQRKAYIDFLQKNKRQNDIRNAVAEYRHARGLDMITDEKPRAPEENNYGKTYAEFADKWLAVYARKKHFSPNTYDSYRHNLDAHILPHFGDWVVGAITGEDIDIFLDHLREKPCGGSKSYNKKPEEIPRLGSATIKKCYNILTASLKTAKSWNYVKEVPETFAPVEKSKKRGFWTPEEVDRFLDDCREDKLLHLAVHLGFVCSLRIGEAIGIKASDINVKSQTLWINQILQRVSDQALAELNSEDVYYVFPKQKKTSTSQLILKKPKTDGSTRSIFLTTPLSLEVVDRLEQIKRDKNYFGEDYHDYRLLICQPDGRPYEANRMEKHFRAYQARLEVENKIEYQGLRKSGQMHKLRLTHNDFGLVADLGGHSPEVLNANYNECLDSEMRALAMLIEKSFYGSSKTRLGASAYDESVEVMEMVMKDPTLMQKIMRLMHEHTPDAVHAQ